MTGAPKKESSVASEYERERMTKAEGTSLLSAFFSNEELFQKVTPCALSTPASWEAAYSLLPSRRTLPSAWGS